MTLKTSRLSQERNARSSEELTLLGNDEYKETYAGQQVEHKRYQSKRRLLIAGASLLLAAIGLVALLSYGYSSRRKAEAVPHVGQVRLFRPQEALEKRLDQDLERLESEYGPLENKQQWPRRLWQTWRTTGMVKERATWQTLNPAWRYEMLLDEAAEALVEKEYAQVPDIIAAYKNYSLPVLKADLLRYLLLFRFGGLYADADVKCVRNISSWLPADVWHDQTIHTVVGTEIDFLEATQSQMNRWEWSRPFQFAQYAMLTKPFSPAARRAIINTISRTHDLMRLQNTTSISQVTWSRYDVLRATGPEAWTQAVLTSMTDEQPAEITWLEFARQKYITTNRNVAILPIDAFGAGQPHSGSTSASNNPQVLLLHAHQGSWKGNAPNLLKYFG